MKTLKNLFKPEHWGDINGWDHGMSYRDKDVAAKIAQKILDQFIEENGVKVYGWPASKGKTIWNPDRTCFDDNPTWQALIFDIEDIPEEQCEHKEAICDEFGDKTRFKCRDCGKPVKAKGWETV